MLFAEELGPVGWTAVCGSGITAILAAFTTVFNLRRTARKEDGDAVHKEEDRIISQHLEMYARQKKQFDDDKMELNFRIDKLEKRVMEGEQDRAKVWSKYLQEVARRRYAEGVLKQNKINIESWDGTATEMPPFDSTMSPPPKPPTEGK